MTVILERIHASSGYGGIDLTYQAAGNNDALLFVSSSPWHLVIPFLTVTNLTGFPPNPDLLFPPSHTDYRCTGREVCASVLDYG